MPMTGLTGSRVRERRLAAGIGQADLARAAGISPSYLNLIEHNRRRIGDAVLGRIAVALMVDPAMLSDGADTGLGQDLRAAAGLASGLALGATPEVDRIDEFLGRFPGWADLLALQFRRIGDLERLAGALNDRISHDPHLSQALHEVLSAVSSVRSTAAILAETEDIEPEWRARFHGNLHADSERLAVGAETLVAYLDGSEHQADSAATAPQEELEEWLAQRGWHFAELEAGGAGPEALEAEIAGLASAAARSLAKAWVAQAASDAQRLPLATFEAALDAQGTGDPMALAQIFDADVLRVFRRLAFRRDAPEGLVLCDASGALMLRKPVEGFGIPRHGAACGLWPLYSALARPSQPVSASAEMPGLAPQRYHLRAYCGVRYPLGFDGPQLRDAAMLILPQGALGGPAALPALAIGSSCRICPRAGCPARREPSIMAEIA